MKIDFIELAKHFAEIGLELLAVDSGLPLAEDGGHLQSWQEAGYAGEMAYMLRDKSLLANPQKIFPDLKSILILGVRYASQTRQALPLGHGRVARYAWGKDYHSINKELLNSAILSLQEKLKCNFKHRIFSDSVPILERALARRAGLGFVGKNTMLIKPRIGSFFFLTEVLTDLEIIKSLPIVAERASCKTCRRCLELCPTNALIAERQLDARKCISYLSIEKRGILNEWESAALGDWIFGCDICQEVCPFNYQVLKESKPPRINEFSAAAGIGESLELARVLKIKSNREFLKIFNDTALTRTGRKGLIRNATCVAANTNCQELLPLLLELAQEDKAEVIRWHAFKAAWKLSSTKKELCLQKLFQKFRASLSAEVISDFEISNL